MRVLGLHMYKNYWFSLVLSRVEKIWDRRWLGAGAAKLIFQRKGGNLKS